MSVSATAHNVCIPSGGVGPTGPTGPIGPTGPAGSSSLLTGNTIWVDAVYGNDSTRQRSVASLPFLTVEAALSASGIASGDTVFIRPGTYSLAAGITIPAGVCLSGQSPGASTLRMAGVTADTVMVSMSDGSLLNLVDIELSTAGDNELIALLFPSSLISVAHLSDVNISVSKVATSGTKRTIGVLSQSALSPLSNDTFIRSCSVLVDSTGTGVNRGVLVDTAAGSLNCRDISVSCTGSGSAIGIEVNFPGATISAISGAVLGTTADISQTNGIIQCALALLSSNANGLGFYSLAVTSLIEYGVSGNIQSGASRFMIPGSGSDAATDRKIRIPRRCVIKSLSMHAGTAPGGVDTCTVFLRKNGVDTGYSVTIVGTQTTNQNLASSISYDSGDDISFRIQKSSNGSGASDIYATVEMY